MLCVLELNLSIIGGSIPVLKPFVRRVFPRLLGSSPQARFAPSYLQASIHVQRHGASDYLELCPRPKSSHTGDIWSEANSDSHIISSPSAGPSLLDEKPTLITKTIEYGYATETHGMESLGVTLDLSSSNGYNNNLSTCIFCSVNFVTKGELPDRLPRQVSATLSWLKKVVLA